VLKFAILFKTSAISMVHALLLQLPVPQLNYGHQTGNIPFGAACLYQSVAHVPNARVEIFSQIDASYMGDAALLDNILARRPDIIGFTTYVWNVARVLYLIKALKAHYSPRIVVGGPEVTEDNPLLDNNLIDFRVYGEGERLFAQLLQEPALWAHRCGCSDAGDRFVESSSPYLSSPLVPEIEDNMLLETMRGCPYACAYCYYGKSRGRPLFKEDPSVLEGIKWALARNLKEIYFLDPSLNSRPGLKTLLEQIAVLNKDHRLSLISEIRADAVDGALADLLAAAGFTWFEIGLQSTNPSALSKMHRKADLNRFLKGVDALKQRGITTAVDLIVGLPGDDWAGFEKTLQFVLDNKLHEDIQVFPLSILPGTKFRRDAQRLGLVYEKHPPYTVIQTPTFTQREILKSFEHAEKRLDVSLYPMPDLDLSWRVGTEGQMETEADMSVVLDKHRLLYKVWLRRGRSLEDLAGLARRVTQPYQLLIPPTNDEAEFVARALSIFTAANPHTPLELVFFDPPRMPAVRRLLQASRMSRPHYLDGDLRPLFDQGGNRSIMFTVATMEMKARFEGPMQRHVHWWRYPHLPTPEAIHGLEAQGFDGILVDPPLPTDRLRAWQDKMTCQADDLLHISFPQAGLYKRWVRKTCGDDYCLQVLP
jgi:hypothetical protein